MQNNLTCESDLNEFAKLQDFAASRMTKKDLHAAIIAADPVLRDLRPISRFERAMASHMQARFPHTAAAYGF